METTISEMKNSIDGFNISDAVRQEIAEYEVREIETIYTEAQEEKKKNLGKSGQNLSDVWNIIKQPNKSVWILEWNGTRERERERGD